MLLVDDHQVGWFATDRHTADWIALGDPTPRRNCGLCHGSLTSQRGQERDLVEQQAGYEEMLPHTFLTTLSKLFGVVGVAQECHNRPCAGLDVVNQHAANTVRHLQRDSSSPSSHNRRPFP